MSESLVIDSSVAVKWYLPESGSDRAASLLGDDRRLIAPDLLLAEIGNVLWKRRRDLPAAEIEAIVVALTFASPVSLFASSLLLQGAVLIALAYERTVYDSLYLALAVSEHCQLVTADKRLSNALQNTGLHEFVQVL